MSVYAHNIILQAVIPKLLRLKGSEAMNGTQIAPEAEIKRTGVLLVTLIRRTEDEDSAMRSIDELRLLCETALDGECDVTDFYILSQIKSSPEAATYIGSGKAEEAAKLCLDHDISLVVFDTELSPSQIRNNEEIIEKYDKKNDGVRVIDRTMLILDIFAKHAVTGEGKLQVEIAQLKYTAPRLTGKGIALSRQGGTSGAVGARGPGETKLETDRRHIRRRIESLEAGLADMEAARSIKRSKRMGSGVCNIAIAGYTNAGKSTLLNYLTDAGILAENKLFATLDPTTRRLSLPSGKEVLLTDTVGFISNLPHKLVEAFKSTLDEVKYADILLIVVDASDEDYADKTAVTERIIGELSKEGKPRIIVYNKCDGLEVLPYGGDRERLSEIPAVCISAKTGAGVPELLELIENTVNSLSREVTFLFPFDMQSAVNTLYRRSTVLETEYTDSGTRVKVLADDEVLGKYADYIVTEE